MASIFTKIIKGDIPSHRVYEDDKVVAFLDIHPINPGHTLVVPREEVDHFDDMNDELFLHCMKVAKQLAKMQKQVFSPARVGLIIAGFDVPHAHIHVFPMHSHSDIPSVQDMDAEPDHAQLAEIATKLSEKA